MKTKTNLWEVLLGLLITLAVGFYSAFVCMKLFNWFITPITLTPFTYWLTYGICLIINLFTLKVDLNKNEEHAATLTEIIALNIIKVILVSIIFGIGALVQLGV